MKKNNIVVKNTIWIFSQNVICSLCSFFLVYFSARRLGKENWGIYNYASSVLSIASTACLFGMNSVLVEIFSRDKEHQNEVLGTALAIRRILAIIAMIFVFAVLYFSLGTDGSIVIALFFSASLLFQGYLIYNEWFIANSCSKFYSISVIFANVITVLWKLFFLFKTNSLQYFCAGVLVENVIILLCTHHFIKRQLNSIHSFSRNKLSEIIRKSKYFAISDLAIIIYTEIDKIIIKQLLSNGEVGVYSAAVSIANLWLFVPMALYYSARPSILEKWDVDKEKAGNELRRLSYQLLGICVSFILIIFIFKKWIILFLYGDQYLDCINTLMILSFSMTFSICGTLGTVWILGENLGKYSTYRTVLGLFLNIVLDILFIRKWGMIGAAIGTFISYFFSGVLSLVFWKKTRSFYKIFKTK